MRYQIQGEPFPVVTCELAPGESVVTERGGMSWMSPNMKMQTSTNGGVGKAIGRMFARESLFQNIYTAEGGPGMISFSASAPGSIRALEITPEKSYIVQKSGFLASERGVNLDIFFQKKIAGGLFGGEGFILQKLSGRGIAFVEIDGSAVEYQLAPGQQIIVGTGYMALMEDTCSFDVQMVPGLKNIFFGGEGLFNTVITGPGRVVLQTTPINELASELLKFMPTSK